MGDSIYGLFLYIVRNYQILYTDSGNEITVALNKLKEQSDTVKAGYDQILSLTNQLSIVMTELTSLSVKQTVV